MRAAFAFFVTIAAGASSCAPPSIKPPPPPSGCRYIDAVHRLERAFATLPDHDRWQLALSPPLPTNYPNPAHRMFTVVAFAIAPGGSPDTLRIAAPWARTTYLIDDGGEPSLDAVSSTLREIGVQHVEPISPGDPATPESLGDTCHALDVARTQPELPDDLGRRYCTWVARNPVIAPAVRKTEPAFFDALRCGAAAAK